MTCLSLQAAMYQNIGNISVVGVTFDSNVATGSGGGLYQNSFAGDACPLLHNNARQLRAVVDGRYSLQCQLQLLLSQQPVMFNYSQCSLLCSTVVATQSDSIT